MEMRREASCFAAAAGVSAVLTAGFGWQETALGWVIGAIIRILLGRRADRQRQFHWAQIVIGGMIAAAGAQVAEQAFPQDSTFPFVSLCLMLLMLRAMRSENAGLEACNAAAMMILPLLGCIVGLGCIGIQWKEIMPETIAWRRVAITTDISMIWLQTSRKNQSWGWYLLCGTVCTGMSLVTEGHLGRALVESTQHPLFLMVQTIKAFGKLQRLEALAAAASLIGAFALMRIGGEMIRDGWENGLGKERGQRKKSAFNGASAAVAIAIETGYRMANDSMALYLRYIFWGVMTIYILWVEIFEKNEKRA